VGGPGPQSGRFQDPLLTEGVKGPSAIGLSSSDGPRFFFLILDHGWEGGSERAEGEFRFTAPEAEGFGQ
jgi:hypothetical protein